MKCIFIFFASLRGNFKERMIVLSNESEIYSLVYGELGSLLTVSDISLNLWFGDMTIVKLTEDKVYLKTDNDYKKHIILSKYSSQLCAAFEKVLGFAVEPVIISTENRGLEEQLEEALSGKVLQAEPENTDKKENISEEEIKKKLFEDLKDNPKYNVARKIVDIRLVEYDIPTPQSCKRFTC